MKSLELPIPINAGLNAEGVFFTPLEIARELGVSDKRVRERAIGYLKAGKMEPGVHAFTANFQDKHNFRWMIHAARFYQLADDLKKETERSAPSIPEQIVTKQNASSTVVAPEGDNARSEPAPNDLVSFLKDQITDLTGIVKNRDEENDELRKELRESEGAKIELTRLKETLSFLLPEGVENKKAEVVGPRSAESDGVGF